MQNNYGFAKSVALGFETAVANVTRQLMNDGFGVLSDTDAAATMKTL